jgi:hypothetical protein
MTDIAKALGLGVKGKSIFYSSRYAYGDVTATQELAKMTGDEAGLVIGSEYCTDDDEVQEDYSREHFQMCNAVARKFGRELRLVMEETPDIEPLLGYYTRRK